MIPVEFLASMNTANACGVGARAGKLLQALSFLLGTYPQSWQADFCLLIWIFLGFGGLGFFLVGWCFLFYGLGFELINSILFFKKDETMLCLPGCVNTLWDPMDPPVKRSKGWEGVSAELLSVLVMLMNWIKVIFNVHPLCSVGVATSPLGTLSSGWGSAARHPHSEETSFFSIVLKHCSEHALSPLSRSGMDKLL